MGMSTTLNSAYADKVRNVNYFQHWHWFLLRKSGIQLTANYIMCLITEWTGNMNGTKSSARWDILWQKVRAVSKSESFWSCAFSDGNEAMWMAESFAFWNFLNQKCVWKCVCGGGGVCFGVQSNKTLNCIMLSSWGWEQFKVILKCFQSKICTQNAYMPSTYAINSVN